MRQVVVLLFAIAAALFASSARADLPPRTFHLETHTEGTGCPDAADVRDALSLALRVDPVVPKASARLVVTLVQAGENARGSWEMFGPDGTKLRDRSLAITGSCRELAKSLALTFAIFYDTPAVTPPGCDAVCRAQAREEARRELLAEGYRPPMDLKIAVMTGALVSGNFTADPGPGAFLAAELHSGIVSGALEARVLFPSRVVALPSGFTFNMTTIGAALVPCARWKVLLGCAVFDVGMLISGGDISNANNPIIATLGIGPRVAVHIPFVERFAVRAFADLRFAPVPSTTNFIDTGDKWQSEVVSGLFGLGIAFE